MTKTAGEFLYGLAMPVARVILPTSLKNKIKHEMRVRQRRKIAMRYYTRHLNVIDTWIQKDTEEANFYYQLSDRNKNHLAHLLANVTGHPREEILKYFDELESDEELRAHIEKAVKAAGYGNDIRVNYGRRLGWYAVARITKPRVIIETGIDHGVGSCVLTSALLRNAAEGHPGRYFGTDINPKAGQLLVGKYATTGQVLYGDSIMSLKAFDQQIDLFINDSDHSESYEYQEYLTVADKLSGRSVILGDNSHVTDSLSTFCEENGRQFVFFAEKPIDHWYPGAGIGISYKSPNI